MPIAIICEQLPNSNNGLTKKGLLLHYLVEAEAKVYEKQPST